MPLPSPAPSPSPSPPSNGGRRRFVGGLGLVAVGTVLGAALERRFRVASGLVESVRRWRTGHREWTDGEGAVIPPSDIGRLELFILAGQSNMSGRGYDTPSEPTTRPVYVFGNDYRWHRGVEPVDNGDAQVDRVSYDVVIGVGPGLSFGERRSELNPGVPVGLIPCAMGGSSIADWQRSLDERTLYGSMLKRCRAASPMGTIRGLLFFQGESDAVGDGPSLWKDQFEALVSSLRQDLNEPDLPVVFAQIGTARQWPDPAAWSRLQEVQADIQIPGVAMITTRDLPLADGLHFTTDAYREIGRRFADALQELSPNDARVSGSRASPP